MSHFPIFHQPIADSSQSEARRCLQRQPTPFAVRVDQQTRGQGRLGRGWQTSKGNLALSMVIQPSQVMQPYLSLVLGVVVYRVLLKHLCINAQSSPLLQLKWPNDLLLDGGKLCGMLIEVSTWPELHAVMGIGVNVGSAPRLGDYPTACLAEYRVSVSTQQLSEEIVRQWQLECEKDFDLPTLLQEWQDGAHPAGTALRVRHQGQTLVGQFAGLNAEGALLLDAGNDDQHVIISAESVQHLLSVNDQANDTAMPEKHT